MEVSSCMLYWVAHNCLDRTALVDAFIARCFDPMPFDYIDLAYKWDDGDESVWCVDMGKIGKQAWMGWVDWAWRRWEK